MSWERFSRGVRVGQPFVSIGSDKARIGLSRAAAKLLGAKHGGPISIYFDRDGNRLGFATERRGEFRLAALTSTDQYQICATDFIRAHPEIQCGRRYLAHMENGILVAPLDDKELPDEEEPESQPEAAPEQKPRPPKKAAKKKKEAPSSSAAEKAAARRAAKTTAALKSVYGLSAAEASRAVSLYPGKSADQIAAALRRAGDL